MYFQLALQTKFHGPLAYPPPYPPRPIFQRARPPELSAAETGTSAVQYEASFYKNAYAMVGRWRLLAADAYSVPAASSRMRRRTKRCSTFSS